MHIYVYVCVCVYVCLFFFYYFIRFSNQNIVKKDGETKM